MLELITYCWHSIKVKRRLMGYSLLCLIAMTCSVLLPYLTGVVINLLVGRSCDSTVFIGLCILLAVVYCVQAVCYYLSSLLYTYIEADSSYQIERGATSHIQHLPVTFYMDFDPGYWRRRLDDDSNGLAMWFMSAMTGILEHGCLLLIMLAVLCSISQTLFFASLVLAVASTIVVAAFKMSLHDASSKFVQKMSNYSSVALRQLLLAEFIRRNSLFRNSLSRLDDAFLDVRETMYESNRVGARASLAYELVVGLSTSAVVLVAALEVANGRMEPGYVATAVGYFGSIAASVQALFGAFGKDLQGAKVHYERMNELEKLDEEPVGTGTARSVPTIELSEVSQRWPGEDAYTLQGVNAHFARGLVYGITGTNGSGKTTLLRTMAGELRGTVDGEVVIGGEQLGDLDQYELRKSTIGFVDQHPTIVSGTLWENLTLLCGADVEEARVISLAEDVGLQKVLRNPDGTQLVLDDTHPALSGGEQQKVSIVRAMLKSPEVLLLDEPSSALDAESRAALASVLKRDKANRITIVVTHDDELLDVCDKVIRL